MGHDPDRTAAAVSEDIELKTIWQAVGPQRVLDFLHRDLNVLYANVRVFTPDILIKVIRPLNRFRNGFEISDISGDGAFYLDRTREIMTLRRDAIEAMIKMVISHPATKSTSDIRAIAERLVEAYALHETIHISQNLVKFAEVGHVKQLASPDLLGILDLLADHDAARIASALHVVRIGGSDRRRFLDELLKTLVVVNEIAPRTFKSPPDKPHKRRRFFGSVLTTTLLSSTLRTDTWREFERKRFSLETPLYPYFDLNTGRTMVLGLAPEPRILVPSRGVPLKLLKETVESLDSSPLELTMRRAREILVYLRILNIAGSDPGENATLVI